ncbi:MAG: S24/S26 family peptidase, partial [Clostridia bacterium]|nr:S24/S26 family peptidase [Clostridia bacterium]
MSEEIKKTEQGQSSLPERETGEREMTLLEVVFEWTSALIFALVFVLLLLTFVFRQVTVSGPSMNDTLQDGDRLVV